MQEKLEKFLFWKKKILSTLLFEPTCLFETYLRVDSKLEKIIGI